MMVNFWDWLARATDFSASIRKSKSSKPIDPELFFEPATDKETLSENKIGLNKAFLEESDNLRRYKPNVLIVGRSGSGKSALINAIFGKDVAKVAAGSPVTQHYEQYTSDELLVNLYDSKGWEGGTANDQEFQESTRNFISQHKTSNPDEHIHIIWYVVQASSARFEPYEVELIKNVFKGIPLLLILSKCDITRSDQLEALKATIKKSKVKTIGIIETSADPLNTDMTIYGLQEIVAKTIDALPELQGRAFTVAQKVDFQKKDSLAMTTITAAMGTASLSAAIPIPFADISAITSVQMAMIGSLASIYGLNSKNLLPLVNASIMPILTAWLVPNLFSSAVKFFPGVGTITGSAISAGLAATVTFVVGYSCKQLFRQMYFLHESGQTKKITNPWAKQVLRTALYYAFEHANQRPNLPDLDFSKPY